MDNHLSTNHLFWTITVLTLWVFLNNQEWWVMDSFLQWIHQWNKRKYLKIKGRILCRLKIYKNEHVSTNLQLFCNQLNKSNKISHRTNSYQKTTSSKLVEEKYKTTNFLRKDDTKKVIKKGKKKSTRGNLWKRLVNLHLKMVTKKLLNISILMSKIQEDGWLCILII